MSGISFDTSQVNRLAVDLTKAPGSTQRLVSQAIAETAGDTKRDMKIFCPVLTGAMRESIDADIGFLSADIGPNVYYAHFVEFGTSRQAPEPFAAPAFEKNAPKLRSRIEQISDNFL